MRGQLAQMMQQAQKMQESVQKIQAELAQMEINGSAGAGMVTVTLSGTKACRKVRIDPTILSDQEMLEDLIAAAFNDACNRVDTQTQERMGSLAGGLNLNLPEGFKLPF